MHTFSRFLRAAPLVVWLASVAVAAAQGTWTDSTWTDPATDGARTAIETPIEFGPDGLGVFACTAEGAGGLTFVLQAEDFAALPPGEVTMSYRMDMEPEVIAFSSWTRSEDGTVVRFAGTSEELAALVDQMSGVTSPAFFWVTGPSPTTEAEMQAAQDEGRVAVAVLESQGFAEALAGLPCAP